MFLRVRRGIGLPALIVVAVAATALSAPFAGSGPNTPNLASRGLVARWQAIFDPAVYSTTQESANFRLALLRTELAIATQRGLAIGAGAGSVTDRRTLDGRTNPLYDTSVGRKAIAFSYQYDGNWGLLVVEVGALGLAGYLLLLVACGRLGWRGRLAWCGEALTALVVAILALGFFAPVMQLRLPMLLFWVLVGITTTVAQASVRPPKIVRILVVTNMWPTPDEPTFGTFVKEQVDDCRAVGHEVDVVSFDGRTHATHYVSATLVVARRVRQFRPDVVHAHYGLSGAVAVAQRSAPTVVTFHGSDVGYKRWQVPISRVVSRHTTPVFVSRSGARALGVGSPIVLPIGVDTALFKPSDVISARRELGWEKDELVVVFPGRPSNRVKNHPLFVATVEQLTARGVGVRGVVLDMLSRAEVAQRLAAADVMIMTSHSEGSPVALRESLACRTPVVSVDVGDASEVLEGLDGCAICPRSAAALAEAALAARGRRDAALRERVMRRTERRATALRLTALYEDVVSRARRA